MIKRLFFRYPWLFFALAIFLVGKTYYEAAPGQEVHPNSWIAPAAMCFFGVVGYVVKYLMPGQD